MNVFIYSPRAGELMHLIVNNQSGLEKKKPIHCFSLSVSALEMFFPIKLSHLLSAVFVCLVSITEHTTFDGLKLI